MVRKSMQFFPIIACFFGLVLLQACTPVGTGATVAATVGAVALEERSLKDSIKDRKMKLDLLADLTRIGLGIFSRVNVNVVEGAFCSQVLLTPTNNALTSPKLHGETKMFVMSSMKF